MMMNKKILFSLLLSLLLVFCVSSAAFAAKTASSSAATTASTTEASADRKNSTAETDRSDPQGGGEINDSDQAGGTTEVSFADPFEKAFTNNKALTKTATKAAVGIMIAFCFIPMAVFLVLMIVFICKYQANRKKIENYEKEYGPLPPIGAVPNGNPPYGAPAGNPPYRAPNAPYGAPNMNRPYGAPAGAPPYGAPNTNRPYGAPAGAPPYGAPNVNAPFNAPPTPPMPEQQKGSYEAKPGEAPTEERTEAPAQNNDTEDNQNA